MKHFWIMILCCLIPVLFLLVLYFFGISNKFTFLLVAILCPITHLIMMKYMYKGEEKCH